MNRTISFYTTTLALVLTLSACSLFNPFVGKWTSGVFELDFKADKTFTLVIGHTISVNLKGSYSYSDDTLTLKIDDGSEATFTYALKDGNKELELTPETEFEYIKTTLTLRKE